jgi:uncharacterized delta-60 repeat protein
MPQLARSRFFQLRILIAVVLIALFLSSAHLMPVQAAAGDLDPTFGVGGKVTTDLFGGNDDAGGAVIQPDGKIIVVGVGAGPNGQGGLVLVRYNPDGSLDLTFGSGGRVISSGLNPNCAVLQADGKIVMAGGAGALGFGLQRYNGDGSLDLTFGPGGTVTTQISGLFFSTANAVAVQPNGKIVAAGLVDTNFIFRQKPDFAIVRYNSDGTLDSTFGAGGKVTTDFLGFDDVAKGVAVQADGKIIAAGFAGLIGPPFLLHQFAVARYNIDGTLDSTFGVGGKLRPFFFGGHDEGNAVALLSNGQIIVAGFATNNNLPSITDFAMTRLNGNGSTDSSFGSSGKVATDFGSEFDSANSIGMQPDGKIVLVGVVSKGPSQDETDFAVARYNADGSLDQSFGSTGKVTTDFFGHSNIARVALLQRDGKIVAVGTADRAGRFVSGDFALARYEGTPFDLCLQDDSTGNLLQFNSTTGEYQFTNCSGFTLGGTGAITKRGSMITLQHNGTDRRLLARIDGGVNKGTASLQALAQGTTFTITDRNTLNNTCSCGGAH